MAAQPTPADSHDASVRADYEARVDLWRTIYEGASFHDYVIRDRLVRALRIVDRLEPGSALDVGCGAGQLVAELARRGWRTSGVDVAEGMVEATRERLADAGLEADVAVGDVRTLPYEDGSLDLVTALGVIEYLKDPRDALRGMARVLRPGGHLIVTTPNPVRIAFLADPVAILMGLLGPPPRGYPRKYLHRWALARSLRETGFEVEQLLGHGIGPWQFAKRPLLPAQRSIAIDHWLDRRLPEQAKSVLGANLIALARRR